jgi:diguanylate cyclase (GGDEF)-like protein
MNFMESMNARWRMELFRICVVLAAMGSAAEIVIYKYDAAHRTLFLEHRLYRFRFIYIPSSLNLIIILITYFCLKSKKLSNKAKNVWACLLIYFLCANTQVIHYVYGPLLMLPCVAIFMTILFGDKRITTMSLCLSFVSLAMAARQASVELRKGDPQLPTDILLAVIVMLATYIGSMLLINYVSEQTNYILASNARQMQLIEECNMDALMGIKNRRGLDERLSEVVSGGNTAGAMQLLMLDIDDFKKINDTYGHINGDEVLIKLGDILDDIGGNSNFEPFRYGGEEIVVLMLNTGREEAVRIAGEILSEFSGSTLSFNMKIRATFSGGIAGYEPGMTPEQWIEKADMKLYRAKKNGKNRIEA